MNTFEAGISISQNSTRIISRIDAISNPTRSLRMVRNLFRNVMIDNLILLFISIKLLHCSRMAD